MGTNGFYGNLQGPFEANQELFNIIKADSKYESDNSVYITKLGIHIVNNYDLKISNNFENILINKLFQTGPIVIINGKEFQIGRTGILELEDVKIDSIIFPKDIDERCFIDYQIKKFEE